MTAKNRARPLPVPEDYAAKTLQVPPVPQLVPTPVRDISSTGVYFLCPRPLPVGASLEIDVVLVSKPMGHGSVVLSTRAHVQRHEPASMPGWYGIAASFDDVQFDRDDRVPSRFLIP